MRSYNMLPDFARKPRWCLANEASFLGEVGTSEGDQIIGLCPPEDEVEAFYIAAVFTLIVHTGSKDDVLHISPPIVLVRRLMPRYSDYLIFRKVLAR